MVMASGASIYNQRIATVEPVFGSRRIRQQPWGKNMVLVALTGWEQEENRSRSKDAGFDDHMVKPVEPAALTKLLASLPAGMRAS